MAGLKYKGMARPGVNGARRGFVQCSGGHWVSPRAMKGSQCIFCDPEFNGRPDAKDLRGMEVKECTYYHTGQKNTLAGLIGFFRRKEGRVYKMKAGILQRLA